MEYLNGGSSYQSVPAHRSESRQLIDQTSGDDALQHFEFKTPKEVSAELPYERSLLEPTIVHFGPSNFFRSHFATIIEDTNLDISRRGGVPTDGVAVVSMMSPGVTQSLRNQDHVYTVGEISADDKRSVKAVGSVIDSVFSKENPDKTADLLKGADLVSLTVTFKGYHVQDSSGQIEGTQDNDVVHDASVLKLRLQGNSFGEIGDGSGYRTPMGPIVEELLRRDREGGVMPVLMSLDNTPPFANGTVLRESLKGLVDAFGWQSSGAGENEVYRRGNDAIDRLVILSTVVDRITPQQHQVDREWLQKDHNLFDPLAVIAEQHRSLKYQAIDPHGVLRSQNVRLPDFVHSSHVIRVDDVQAEIDLKSRCLNSLDVVAGQIGTRIGARTVWDFVSNPVMESLEDSVLTTELSRGVQSLPRLYVLGFSDEVRDRRRNKEISAINELSRLNNKGSEKMPARIGAALGAIIDHPEDGKVLTLTYACYLRNIIDGVNEKGEPVKLQDDNPKAVESIQDSFYAGAERALVEAVGEGSEFYKYLKLFPSFSEGLQSGLELLRTDGNHDIADSLEELAQMAGIDAVLKEQKWLFGYGEVSKLPNADNLNFQQQLQGFYVRLGRLPAAEIAKEIVNPVNKHDN